MTIVIGILVFCVIIIIHEMGHFFVAKFCGMKVYEFSLGMGPTILKKKGKETVYSLKLLPIGGSVQLGEDEEADEDPRSFRNKPVWMRMLVIVAGATMNLILGLIVCIISSASGEYITTNTIRGFYDDAGSNQYLMAGDEILSVNGMPIWTTMDISYQLQNSVAKSNAETETLLFDFEVRRNGETFLLKNVEFKKSTVLYYDLMLTDKSQAEALKHVLDSVDKEVIPVTVTEISTDGTITGYKCRFNNYGETKTKADIQTVLSMAQQTGIALEEKETYGLNESVFLDFHMQFYKNDNELALHGIGILDVLSDAFGHFASEARLIWVTLLDMISGTYGLNDLSGPVGVVETIGNVASTMSFSSLMTMISFLTINVGIFNLLPIPALDGARFVFLLIEAIRRKPIKAEVEGMIHFVGLMAMLLLMLVVTFNDIKRIFFGG